MTLHVWRIVQKQWASSAFSGEGARRFGGRWNSAGRPLVYTAEHPALAAMEMLVHLSAEQLLKTAYVLIEATLDDTLVDVIPPGRLPPKWGVDPAPMAAQRFGDDWLTAPGSRLALRVPSAVLPGWNYLLNPNHPQFDQLQVGIAQPFGFDARLKK